MTTPMIAAQVIDTPDITNCNMNANEQRAEVAKWRELTRSDPAVVILTVRCDVRYTAEEYAIYKEINALWGGNSLKKKLIVAFTFADLQDNPLEEELKTVCPELRSVLRDCTDTWVRFSKVSGWFLCFRSGWLACLLVVCSFVRLLVCLFVRLFVCLLPRGVFVDEVNVMSEWN